MDGCAGGFDFEFIALGATSMDEVREHLDVDVEMKKQLKKSRTNFFTVGLLPYGTTAGRSGRTPPLPYPPDGAVDDTRLPTTLNLMHPPRTAGCSQSDKLNNPIAGEAVLLIHSGEARLSLRGHGQSINNL